MKSIQFEGRTVEITAIRFIFADEKEIQDGVLVHDTADEFHDGDMIYCARIDEINDADDLKQLFEDTGCTVFTCDENGTYHAEA